MIARAVPLTPLVGRPVFSYSYPLLRYDAKETPREAGAARHGLRTASAPEGREQAGNRLCRLMCP
jgi:hypothetical protein